MRWIPDVARRIRQLIHGEDVAADIDEEIRFHLDARAEWLTGDGTAPDAAKREAARRFGDVARVRRECAALSGRRVRQHRRAGRLADIATDFRDALRAVRSHPTFAAVVVATLALGVGANTAVFSVVRGVVLRPLPYDDPAGLVALWLEFRGQHGGPSREIAASEPEYLELREATRLFSDIAAYWTGEANLGGLDEPVRLSTASVSANFLDVLGVTPHLGRAFAPGEDTPGADPVVMLGHGLWRRAFGADSAVPGRSVLINGRHAVVIGVLPPSFAFPGAAADLLLINVIDRAAPAGRSSHYLSMIGRLGRGTSLAAARAEIATLMTAWAAAFPDRHGPSSAHHPVVASRLLDRLVGDVRPRLAILSAAVALVLLIACVNVANLMLARSESRQRDLGVRAALGAGRWRLVRQTVVESGVLAMLGAAGGLALAWGGAAALRRLAPSDLPRLDAVQVDATVLGFCLLAAVAAGVVFAAAPAFLASGTDPNTTLKEAGATATPGRRRLGARRALVAGEVALAAMLLVAAGLLLRSFQRLHRIDPGFRTSDVVTLDFSLNGATYPTAQAVAQFHTALDERVAALPGVLAAGAVRALPLWETPGWETLTLSGAVAGPDAPDGGQPNGQYQVVSPGYFDALRIPLIEGRAFTTGDHAGAPPVAIVNRTMARRYWADRSPIGASAQLGAYPGNPHPEMTIVGVVDDVLQDRLDGRHEPQLFVPRGQAGVIYGGLGTRFATYVVRAETAPGATMSVVRAVFADLDRDLPVANLQSAARVVDRSVADARFTTLLMTVFSAVALTLGAIGIYGVLAFAVARRTREIGLRLALGAARRRVLLSVVGSGLRLVLVGVTVGVAGALVLTRFLSGLVFGVSVRDPAVFATVPLVLLVVAAIAALLPARRAAQTDPMVAMRQ